MIIGYQRVSTYDQNHALQTDALEAAKCEKIFTDTVSGAKTDRPGLNAALDILREGDTFIVYKLDRLGRSVGHLIETVKWFDEHKVNFVSIKDQIDTSSSMGKFYFHVVAAFAELERDLIRERTQAGREAARARGRVGGRKSKISDETRAAALKMRADRNMSVSKICKALNLKRATFYRITS
jgi:DNA invertase Pin-like site-specific DNA recombinase